MATIRIILEFEQDEATITPAVLAKFWPYSEGDEKNRKLGIESELALLAAVKAHPQITRQLWLQQALSWLEWLENTDVIDLLKPVLPAGPDLEPLAAQLHEYARSYFIEDGILKNTDDYPLVQWVQDLRLRLVKIEDAEGVMLSSDDVPPRLSRKRR